MKNKKLKKESIERLKRGQTFSRYPFTGSKLFTVIRHYPLENEVTVIDHSVNKAILFKTPFHCYKR